MATMTKEHWDELLRRADADAVLKKLCEAPLPASSQFFNRAMQTVPDSPYGAIRFPHRTMVPMDNN